MPVLRKDGQQDHRHPYGKWVSEASEGMYLLRSQMAYDRGADEGGLRRCNGCRGNKKVESQESEV